LTLPATRTGADGKARPTTYAARAVERDGQSGAGRWASARPSG